MSYLLKPLDQCKLTLRNRLVFPPMATSKSEENGGISKALLDYYDEKSHGGYISLIFIEHSFITQQGKASDRQLSVADDSVIGGLKKLADVIHKNGCKAVMQINHAGSATSKAVTGYETVGPSPVVNPRRGLVPSELTKEDINRIIENFKDAAKRVKQAGFDGVEIHSAHGYLLNQFYSPLTNTRRDEYGGDLLGRIKIHLDIIKAVREVVGEDFPILLRLGACDYIEGGITIEDSKRAAVEFEKAGVDILDISGGFCGYIVPGLSGQGYFSDITEAIKEVVSIPVILTGGITEAETAERLLASEKADLIGVGRAIYNDSSWASKALESIK
ncbi:2,4-dienoyl-CoA reductase-like NADH-dependent reductase (Old Yellow Enzyme family) [Clostridium algifaecis]|uniref:2,4-dienoyl-CoA reductase-like NADH-dependent reductase (Old Yellow Enzyme family) n=1 Tax=Clostridium algifaecis TaxID=1472040 RepID=A0ABS4KVG1_9CLOT|nr:NADH:flavin oxidoreductase [Clostridium algifaecis]MBP2034037.1 2,4-dienoyl-CoA reductase-like NADH-dependent reductase (Old Yellow Enzyme family) [Clostridium algifaecis]